jgi:NAD+ diphosphatase
VKPVSTSFQRRRDIRFGELLVDRASERRADQAWLNQLHTDSAAVEVLVDAQGRVLARVHGSVEASWPVLPGAAVQTFLGVVKGVPYFARLIEAERSEALAQERSARWLDLRSFALQSSAQHGGMAAFARGMLYWQQRHRYCGSCGAPTVLEQAGHRATCTDPTCATEHFPRTDPAIIVVVTHGERALLGRQSVWPQKRYSTLAGFVEPGESLEDAVCREVAEESGVIVSDCDYFGSQPWPFPSSLMLGFVAQAESAEIRRGDELEDVRWFDPDEFIELVARREVLPPPPLSVSFSLIAHWLRSTRGHELDRTL